MAVGAISLQPSAMTLSQSKPIIVKIMPQEGDPTGLADVLIGALGLTGVLVLLAVIAAGVFGAVLFWIRSRGERNLEPPPAITPAARPPSHSSATSDTSESR
jgi:hypothetical protein